MGGYSIVERALGETDAEMITHMTPRFALGTANQTYTIGQRGFAIEHQANHCVLHYRVSPAPNDWRLLYTRFVVNDRYLGSIEQHAIRSAQTNFYDQGTFAGVQREGIALALYGLELGPEPIHAVEAMVVLPGPVRPDAVYAGGKVVEASAGHPHALPPDCWSVVIDGDQRVGIRPLAFDALGAPMPADWRILPGGDLALVAPLFRSREAKVFWEYEATSAAFYRRGARAGFAIVAGDAYQYQDTASFARYLDSLVVRETLDADGVQIVTILDRDRQMTIERDLAIGRVRSRTIDGRAIAARTLSSPWAVSLEDGGARLGEASAEAAGPAYLFALDDSNGRPAESCSRWALTTVASRGRFTLRTPVTTISGTRLGTTTLVVESVDGRTIESLSICTADGPGRLTIDRCGSGPVRVLLNATDISARIRWRGNRGKAVLNHE
jgi:hypothetical protein